jgi:hypothetical protein
MRHIHADLMHRIAEDTSLKVFCEEPDGSWTYVQIPAWYPHQEYKIEEPVKPHVHQALIDEAKADPSIEWQYRDDASMSWEDCSLVPSWMKDTEYRKKPKTVDMWQWAYKVSGSPTPECSKGFYKSVEDADRAIAGTLLCKIEGSKITVEEEA